MTDTNVSQIELASYEKKNWGATCQVHHAPIKLCTRLSCRFFFCTVSDEIQGWDLRQKIPLCHQCCSIQYTGGSS